MAVARYLNEEAVTEGVFIPGVPLRDIEQEEYDALPKHLQQTVDASGLYRKTEPDKKPAPEKAATEPTKAKE